MKLSSYNKFERNIDSILNYYFLVNIECIGLIKLQTIVMLKTYIVMVYVLFSFQAIEFLIFKWESEKNINNNKIYYK